MGSFRTFVLRFCLEFISRIAGREEHGAVDGEGAPVAGHPSDAANTAADFVEVNACDVPEPLSQVGSQRTFPSGRGRRRERGLSGKPAGGWGCRPWLGGV